MANIQFGAIVVDARGKIGGQVFRKTATGHTLQRKANQSKNARVGRTQQFQKLVSSLRNYTNLTASDRQILADFSALHPLPNKFGVLRPLPARAMYQKLNANLLTAGYGEVNVRTLSSELPSVAFDNVSFNPSKRGFEFIADAVKYPFYVRIYYSLTQGETTSVDVSKKRLLSVKNVLTGSLNDVPVTTETITKISSFQGSIFWGLQVMNASGWVGAIQWFTGGSRAS